MAVAAVASKGASFLKGNGKYIGLAVLVIVLAIVFRKGIKKLFEEIGNKKEGKQEKDYIETLPPPTDGSGMTDEGGAPTTDPEESAFAAEAKSIANRLETALFGSNTLFGYNTDEEGVFANLIPYNGAELREIAYQFGTRNGYTLVGALQNELCDHTWGCNVFQEGDEYTGQAPGCESYFDQCTEFKFAKAIMKKSDLWR
jgi:hypothetical protein